jgi:hypothetical protein
MNTFGDCHPGQLHRDYPTSLISLLESFRKNQPPDERWSGEGTLIKYQRFFVYSIIIEID